MLFFLPTNCSAAAGADRVQQPFVIMTGKEKCELLRQIRRKVAEANEITMTFPPCPHADGCTRGTCPMCDKEARELAAVLSNMQASGLPVRMQGLLNNADFLATNSTDPEEDSFSPSSRIDQERRFVTMGIVAPPHEPDVFTEVGIPTPDAPDTDSEDTE